MVKILKRRDEIMDYQAIKVGDKVIEPCSDGIRFGITDGELFL